MPAGQASSAEEPHVQQLLRPATERELTRMLGDLSSTGTKTAVVGNGSKSATAIGLSPERGTQSKVTV